MKPVALTPALVRTLTHTTHDLEDIAQAIDHLASTDGGGESERLTGRRLRRVHVNGHRVIYRDSPSGITVLCVRPTVRRRWEGLLS
ncbi:type II toxin-antitoxin system RelE/ParE family toxin [Microbacterium phyllosphaerae]|uniref:type II toxin-antitoxin system RelE/ParE family toxin n=1 Tax=Microbacterium phyllosphaerae TaxID=124798 RepID=UPI0035B62C69